MLFPMGPIFDRKYSRAKLSRDDVSRIATRVFARTGLAPGCDARDIAILLGLTVCGKLGPTEVIGRRKLYYDVSLLRRDRDYRICLALAAHLLDEAGLLSTSNVEALAGAMNRRSSGVFSRSA